MTDRGITTVTVCKRMEGRGVTAPGQSSGEANIRVDPSLGCPVRFRPEGAVVSGADGHPRPGGVGEHLPPGPPGRCVGARRPYPARSGGATGPDRRGGCGQAAAGRPASGGGMPRPAAGELCEESDTGPHSATVGVVGPDMQHIEQEAVLSRPQPWVPAWQSVPPPPYAADSGTPVFDALVRAWRQQGRQLPRCADAVGGPDQGRRSAPDQGRMSAPDQGRRSAPDQGRRSAEVPPGPPAPVLPTRCAVGWWVPRSAASLHRERVPV
jgi:hypothetical protein